MAPQQNSPGIPDLAQEAVNNGRKEILYEGYFYDISSWIKRHPGGGIIEFYTQPGENATIPIKQFHNRSMGRVQNIMKGLPKRPAMPEELGLPPATAQRHKELDDAFQQLHKELEEEGYFKPSLLHTLYRFWEIIAFFFVGYSYFLSSPHTVLSWIGVPLVGLAAGRSLWWMHEGGHCSITGRPKLDHFLQSLALGVASGNSAIWWRSQHNRHHAMPQRLHHDVDLDTLPLLAFNKKVLSSYGTKSGPKKASFFVKHQSKLFVPIDTLLVAIYWKLYLCPRYALKKGAYTDLFFMGLHYWLAYNSLGFYQYLFAAWFTAIYLFLNFSLSHTHTDVTSDTLHWVEYSFVHTVDITPHWLCDFWMGYLNYQIEHHLFPTMPQFRGPVVRKTVMAFAKKHGLPYRCVSYWEGLKLTFKNLDDVSQELK